MPSCVDASGYQQAEAIRHGAVSLASGIRQAVAVAQFALNAADAVSNFRKLSDISSRGISIQEAEHTHLKDVYWPAENRFLAEFTTPRAWESQAVLQKRYAGQLRSSVAGAFAKRLHEMKCNKARYCGNAYSTAMQELLVARAAALATAASLADKIAWAEVQAVGDTDFSRRTQAVAMRQGLIGQASALLASAAGGFATAASDALQSANSALQAFGYERNRVVDGGAFHAQAVQAAQDIPSTSSPDTLAGLRAMKGDDYAAAGAETFAVPDTGQFEGMPLSVGDLGNGSSSYANQPGLTAPASTEGDAAASYDLVRGGKVKISGLQARGTFGTSIVEDFTIDLTKLPLVNAAGWQASGQQSSSMPGSPDGKVNYS